MADTYTLTISIEAHEYYGEFYFVGERYGTGGEVLTHVATDHIMTMEQLPHIEEYLLDTLQAGNNANKAEYEQADPDVACGVHFDVNYQQFTFWVDDHMVEIGDRPTRGDLRSIADELPS